MVLNMAVIGLSGFCIVPRSVRCTVLYIKHFACLNRFAFSSKTSTNDYFGIACSGTEKQDTKISGHQAFLKEFSDLKRKQGKVNSDTDYLTEESCDDPDISQVVHFATFGTVRYDKDNVRPVSKDEILKSDVNEVDNLSTKKCANVAETAHDLSFIDKQYFETPERNAVSQDSESEFKVEQHVGNSSKLRSDVDKLKGGLVFYDKLQKKLSSSSRSRGSMQESIIDQQYFGKEISTDENESVPPSTIKVESPSKREMRWHKNKVIDEDSAWNIALKVRRDMKNKKALADGISYYKESAPQTSSTAVSPKAEAPLDPDRLDSGSVISALLDSVLYNDHGVVVLNKPYGLCTTGEGNWRHSVDKYLPELQAKLCRYDKEGGRLRLVHRLDRQTTGVLLLAKTDETAMLLGEMFAKRQVVKKYFAITKGKPDPLKGTIDIPITEGSVNVGNKTIHRQVLSPVFDSSPRNGRLRHSAVTRYRVLDSRGNAALVEVSPHTGVKHQVRCHLAMGVGCPVLGDHKYSSLTRLIPQRLPEDMLSSLGIRQGQVRHLPVHLHSASIWLPDFIDNKHNLLIKARLPRHFLRNLRRLNLSLPGKF